jgi:hypothetical protein
MRHWPQSLELGAESVYRYKEFDYYTARAMMVIRLRTKKE